MRWFVVIGVVVLVVLASVAAYLTTRGAASAPQLPGQIDAYQAQDDPPVDVIPQSFARASTSVSHRWYVDQASGASLELLATWAGLAPLRARRIDLMSQQLAVQPEELRRYGVVTCLLHHDALAKGVKPTAASVRAVACQRRLPSLTVQATGMSPALEHDPALVARLVLQASESLGSSNG